MEDKEVVYGYHLYDRLYPASTTKILTAYIALKYGNMDDKVTVSANATDFNWDESVCGLRTGDTLSMYDLVCGLLLHSGNDAAVAIAEHISGSEEAFVELMNSEAAALGATDSHFVNPHGLHDDDHYTTAYDLYLIFNECLKDERFCRDHFSESVYSCYNRGRRNNQNRNLDSDSFLCFGRCSCSERSTSYRRENRNDE